MSPPCEKLSPFVDGELTAAEAATFRDHLASCDECARELHGQMMLAALGTRPERVEPVGGGGGNVRALRPSRRWMSRAVAPVLFVSVAAAAAWAVWSRGGPGHEPVAQTAGAPVLEAARTRSSEVRVAYAAADGYRPYDVVRAGGDRRHEDVPLAALASLEAKGDFHGVAAGLLLAGDDERAQTYLEKAPPSPDVDADRAAVLLDRGETADALAALDAVLAKAPAHPQALFNRALALRNLGLELAAAEAFDRVVALGEQGWAAEASQQGAALRAAFERRHAASKGARDAGRAMVAGGPVVPDAIVDGAPEQARIHLYHAVRAAPSSARVRELAPLAQRLDARAGGHVLSAWVERSARADFARRAALAETYGRLALTDAARDPKVTKPYLAALRAAGESDLLLGAMQLAGAAEENVDEYTRLAKGAGDPWFQAMAAQVRANAELGRNDYAAAEETIRRQLGACEGAHVEYRCAQLERNLAVILQREARTSEARAVSLSGLSTSRAFAVDLESAFLLSLADAARLEGSVALMTAYAREVALVAPGDCLFRRTVGEELTAARLTALDLDGALRELADVPRCGAPLTLLSADAIVDAARMGGKPRGLETLADDLRLSRESRAPGDRAYADVVQARLDFLTDPVAGELLARRAVEEAERLPASDPFAAKARRYARLTLAVGAAAAGRAEEAIDEIIAGATSRGGAPAPRRGCALGIAIDQNDALAVTRDVHGVAVADRARRTQAEITPGSLVSTAARGRLAGCPEVRVYALAPLHGTPRLLPPDMAWGYVSGDDAGDAVASGPPRRLVVSDVIPPETLGLPRLGSWGPPMEGSTWLHGGTATPAAVLAEMAGATEIEIHAHGTADAADSAASIVVLSPEADGKYAFSALDLRPGVLRGRPVVVLGACRAARTAAAYYRDAWNLPSAFVRAGARAVFASPSAIRDAEARPFFDAVLARVRAGAPPAAALRDERESWLQRDPGSWVADVIDFE